MKEPSGLETVKIEELKSEIEALRRERDEAKRLAREALEKSHVLSAKAVEGNCIKV